MNDSLQHLERTLGYRYRDPGLLEQALTHRSAGHRNNERLEFLGDSILYCVLSEALFIRHPEAPEGELHLMRASLICGETLAELARGLELADYIRLGPAERKSGARHRDSVLADCFEALVGSILLDGGIETCRERVLAWFAGRLRVASPKTAAKDSKTALQEYLQKRGQPLPTYRLLKTEGPIHRRRFTAACSVGKPPLERPGSGGTKRKAEQAAAAAVLEALYSRAGGTP